MTTKGSVIGSEVDMSSDRIVEINGGRLNLDLLHRVLVARLHCHLTTPVSAHPAWEGRKPLLTSSGGKAA